MDGLRTRLAMALLLAAVLPVAGARADEPSLETLLTGLAGLHGFTIEHAERLGEQPGPAGADGLAEPTARELRAHLTALLVDFSHVLVAARDGRVERLIIGARRTAAPAGAATVVALDTSGQRLRATVEIEAPSGRRLRSALIVDTGASLVVLPASALETLAIPVADREPIELQTANGRTQGVRAKLKALTIGRQRVENVNAAFVDDTKLGSDGLLGQNVLARFQVTIDAANARLLLLPR